MATPWQMARQRVWKVMRLVPQMGGPARERGRVQSHSCASAGAAASASASTAKAANVDW